jgi:hypothetical protein
MIGHWALRLRRQILGDLDLIRGPVLDPVRVYGLNISD